MADREALVEAVVGAWREIDADGRIQDAPAFHDLDEADRQLAFDEAVAQRRLEAALDPAGLTSTAHAILARIRRA